MGKCRYIIANLLMCAKPHVAKLTFAEVFENAIGPIAVRIPVFKSLFACDDDCHWVIRRRYDPSLLLADKARMNVDPSKHSARSGSRMY